MSIAVRVGGRAAANGKAAQPLDWPYLTAPQRALKLAAMYYPVVPSSSRSKNNRHPTVENWQAEATTDETKILGEWGNRWTDTVGIVVGMGDLWGIDWDEPERFAKLLALLPANAARVRSGGGGLHTFFKHDAYSLKRLATLNGAATVPGAKREKAVELYTAPHSFLCPGTRHYRTQELYRWEVEGPARPAPHKFIDALLRLSWEHGAERDGAPRADFVSDNTIRVKEGVDVNHVFVEHGFEVVKMRDRLKYIAIDKTAPCPVAGQPHASRSTWCVFFTPNTRTLRFYCASCKTGDTRDILHGLNIAIDQIEDIAFLKSHILTERPIDEVLPLLIDLLKEDFYVHHGALSLVTEYGKQKEKMTERARKMFPRSDETNIVIPVNDLYVSELLTAKKMIYKETKKGRVRVDAPLPWCRYLINSPAIAPHVARGWRRLRMLARVPLLLPTGDVVGEPGYHAESGVYMDFAPQSFPPLPRLARTPEGLKRQALEGLHKFDPVFQLYPFVNDDDTPRDPAKSKIQWWQTPSGAVVLSAILTVLAKPLLPRVPVIGIDAPKPGYGKTDIVQSVAGCTLGHGVGYMTYEDETEFTKSLLQVFERGDRIILVDNVGSTFVCNALAAATTSEESSSKRILGVYKHSVTTNDALFCITGNQLRFGGDLAARRVIRARLDQDIEHPALRDFFGKPNPPHYSKDHFHELAMAALLILAAFIRAGRPQPKGNAKLYIGSYPEWNELIRGCLLWLGCGDPWKTALGVAEDDPFFEADTALLAEWYGHLGDRAYNLKMLEGNYPTLYAKLFGTDPKKSSTTSVGMRLAHLAGDTKEGYRLVRRKSEGHGFMYSVQWRGDAKAPEVDMYRSEKQQFIRDYVGLAGNCADKKKIPLTAAAIAKSMRDKKAAWEDISSTYVEKLAKEMGIEFEKESNDAR